MDAFCLSPDIPRALVVFPFKVRRTPYVVLATPSSQEAQVGELDRAASPHLGAFLLFRYALTCST
jgi:hypothetical protein